MRNWIYQIHYATSANLSIPEIILLLLLAIIAWHNREDHAWLPTPYCVFLILYITLLRRAPGYNESIRLRLKLWPNAGVWAGNLLNLILYVPCGATSWQWKRKGKKIVAIGFALSVFCEALQYLTGRGMADVNDVLFNTLGTLAGLCIAKRLRFLYKGIIINHNKKLSQPTLKRRFFKKKAAFFSWPGLGKEWC